MSKRPAAGPPAAISAALSAGLALALANGAAASVPISTTLDPAQSSLTVELTLPLGTDSAMSPASGTIDIEVDDAATPTQITLTDLDITLDESIILGFSLGLFGGFNATGTGINIRYADAPLPLGPVPITSGQATFVAVPFQPIGSVNYTATGAVCAGLSTQGLPCTDTIDLATQPIAPTDVPGTISVNGSTITLTSSLDVTVPLDPTDPALGTFRVVGTIVSTGEASAAPCPADITTEGSANGVPDGVVTLSDFSFYLTLWSQADPAADITTEGSANGIPDGAVTLSDFSVYLTLWSAGCP